MNRLMHHVIATFFLLTLCSCAAPKIAQKRVFWPPLPDIPRIEWIGAYSSESDLKAADAKSFLSMIMGEEDSDPLNRPLSVASDGEGKAYVSDAEGAAVRVFDFKLKTVTDFGGKTYSRSFEQVNGLAVDAAGNAYASDTKTRKIYVVTPENTPLKVIDVSEHLELIGRFAIDTVNNRIVIPDVKAHKIVITDLDGKVVQKFGSKGDRDGEFNLPLSVAIEKDGGIVVCDSLNARIQRFTSQGVFVNKFGRRGDGQGDFSLIKGVAVDSEGHIYVTDGKDHRISIFTPQGDLLIVIGGLFAQTAGTRMAAGGFMVPQGIFIDKKDRIFVADQLNKRFQVFQYMNERYLSENPVVEGAKAK